LPLTDLDRTEFIISLKQAGICRGRVKIVMAR